MMSLVYQCLSESRIAGGSQNPGIFPKAVRNRENYLRCPVSGETGKCPGRTSIPIENCAGNELQVANRG